MTDVMIQAYLGRIGCQDLTGVNRENLFRIQEGHLKHIPYENIDIFQGAGMTPLETDYLFDKIILGHRGGYCFELNGLLGELLRSLGYKVEEYFARWHFGEPDAVPMRRHRILKTTADGEEFLVDAGVGCLCPLQPLEYRFDLIQHRNGANYRLVRDAALGCVVQTETPDGFVPFYSFVTDPHFPQDFIYVHYYCSSAPDSVFRTKLMAHIYTDTGRKRIEEAPAADGSLTQVFKIIPWTGEPEVREIRGRRALEQILREEFGIICSLS